MHARSIHVVGEHTDGGSGKRTKRIGSGIFCLDRLFLLFAALRQVEQALLPS